MEDCIFCKIILGKVSSYKVWEDEKHLAFLSIFPNTEGVTVVIPKKHYESYAFNVPEQVLIDLTLATKKVGKILDNKLNVGRTALVFEGLGVNHLHAKLFPLHGTKKDWEQVKSDINTYFDTYPGYVSTHDSKRENEDKLIRISEKLRH